MSSETPNQTLFVGNIDHSIKREDVCNSLYELFTPYGFISEIKLKREEKKTPRIGIRARDGAKYDRPMTYMKTIAFIVFDKAESAAAAKKLHGFQFFNRELFVQFARYTSTSVLLAEGRHPFQEKKKVDPKALANGTGTTIVISKASQNKGVGEPTSVLVVENLIPAFTEEVMRPLFEQFPGIEEMKHFSAQNTLKIEFARLENATVCLKELQGFNMDGKVKLRIRYGS